MINISAHKKIFIVSEYKLLKNSVMSVNVVWNIYNMWAEHKITKLVLWGNF